ncbi:MAG: VCBS repeat-containing protein [Flavobacteriales bacterium]|nr:VCBS repeat-containing protein [Flavobacteriales bacterium]
MSGVRMRLGNYNRTAMLRTSIPLSFVCLLLSCSDTPEEVPTGSHATPQQALEGLFLARPSEDTGIDFLNSVPENNEQNYYIYEYFYNGGGVAIGDVNNDGLPDIYFTSNLTRDKLYLNKGGLRFEDVTENALPKEEKHGWHSGASMADVNGDGWLDIYVCRAGWYPEPAMRTNLLYINEQDGTFKEVAEAWGVADTTRSTQGIFFDQDRDGDLDLYVINAPLQSGSKLFNDDIARLIVQRKSPSDRLYRNEGGKFKDITAESGLWNMGYALGVCVSDLDGNGIQDIYVANDYMERDFMYMGQPNGKYAEEVRQRTGHITNNGMGCDIADYNNDGLPDIVVLDMVSEDHVRSKMNMGAMSTEEFWNSVQFGYHFQYMFNTLQLNNGNGTFSEVGQLAGISKTDWSWAPLLADLDNDGWKDLLVTNGFKRDTRDNDYTIAAEKIAKEQQKVTYEDMLSLIPATKIRNYLFRNNGDLTFSNVSEEWGFTSAVNSNGAAYADLDADGDLDLVINNMEAPSQVYENRSERSGNHWLRVRPEGAGGALAMGCQVTLTTSAGIQFQELQPCRGFQSSVEPILHFGLGPETRVQELVMTWPDGTESLLNDIPVDQVVTIERSSAKPARKKKVVQPMFVEDRTSAPAFKHVENGWDDFAIQVLIPHKRSEDGPLLCVADVNSDGHDDVFVGGARQQSGELFLGNASGSFTRSASRPWADHADREDMGGQFFDADGDGDMDLLVMSGSNETNQYEHHFQPRLYLNDGKGRFAFRSDAFPLLMTSAMRCAVGDVDGDGDEDLFVGGRVIPGQYPRSPRSYLLVNDGTGQFSDVTMERAAHLAEPGMVTDALFMDHDADGDLDLVTMGEWMPIALHRNDGGSFRPWSERTGLEGSEGWWERMVPSDLDKDGDMDLVCGNLGWNSKFHGTADHPLHVYFNDFDDNGKPDVVLAKEQGDVLYPVRGRECSSQQCPDILEKFPSYKAFAHASVEQIYSPEKIASSIHLKAHRMRSAIAWNNGDGTFTLSDLPNIVQTAPMKGIVVFDVNGDDNLDLICAGNHWGAEVETVRYDAGTGRVLLGDGKGGFAPMSIQESGFFVWSNVRDLAVVRNGVGNKPRILVASNNYPLQLFGFNTKSDMLSMR